MKQLLWLIFVLSCLIVSGCSKNATPIVMDNGIQKKMITRCDNDIFCFKKEKYEVAWESYCQPGCGYNRTDCSGFNNYNYAMYPVSYRSNEFIYANDPNGYILTLPAGGNVKK